MRTPRGRFSIAEYKGRIYACGGSDGHREIKMMEVYDGQEDRWRFETDCPTAKASPGTEIIQLFSCSAQLSLKFILLINVKMPTIVGILTFISRINYMIW